MKIFTNKIRLLKADSTRLFSVMALFRAIDDAIDKLWILKKLLPRLKYILRDNYNV